MSLKNRVLSIGLSAAMLMTPAATLAESDYTAGELTTTVISDGYVGGNQINLSAALGMTLDGMLPAEEESAPESAPASESGSVSAASAAD